MIMEDLVLLSSSVVFFFLFCLLAVMLGIIVLSFFRKGRSYPKMFEPVTIVIPAHDEEERIGGCLKAIRKAYYPKEIEVIVVDDGSTDRTSEIAKKFKDVKVIRQRQKGKVGALNKGISVTKNEFVITIDADTEIEKNFVQNIIAPFSDKSVGGVTGFAKPANRHSMISMFQSVEYLYNSLVRDSFGKVFNTAIWFCGSLSCYRKSVLDEIGGFREKTAAEDFDIALQIQRAGYKTVNVTAARGYTYVPETVEALFKQRVRWCKGGMQTIVQNRDMFSLRYGFPLVFLFSMQFFWIAYSLFALPLLGYQILYWLPYNTGSFYDLSFYMVRWFSLLGPAYSLYMIPIWGLSVYTVFGVVAGIMTAIMMIIAFGRFGERIDLKSLSAIIFYFPYTVLLNIMMIGSYISYAASKGEGVFVK